MKRIGIKSPIKNSFWLFKDFKSFEDFLEAHFALFLWTLKLYDVRTFVKSVLYTCACYEAFSDKMREHTVDPIRSLLFVIEGDKRLPRKKPGSNRKYFWRNSGRRTIISSLFTRETFLWTGRNVRFDQARDQDGSFFVCFHAPETKTKERSTKTRKKEVRGKPSPYWLDRLSQWRIYYMANKTFFLAPITIIKGIPVGKFPNGNSFNVEINGSFLCKRAK